MSRGFSWVLLLGLLTLGTPTAAAVPSWPVDQAGVPAPPCVLYDPVLQTTSFCPPGTTVAVTITPPVSDTAFGQGLFTGLTPGGALLANAPAFLYLDETTVVGVGRVAGGAGGLWRSSDGGVTFSQTTLTLGTLNASLSLVRALSGLYILGTNDNPISVQTSTSLQVFTRVAGNGLPNVGSGNVLPYQAGNTILATEDKNQNVCRATVTGSSLSAWTCAIPPTWTGPPSVANALGAFTLAPGPGAGGAGGVWLGVDKATPTANIIRSVDDGATFTAVTTLAEGTGSTKAHSIVCLRNALSTCLIGLNGALYRSTDAGLTWGLVATYTYSGLGAAFLDFGNNVVVAVGGGFATPTVPPGCLPICSVASGLFWARSTDAGATWSVLPGGWVAQAGSAADRWVSAVTSPTTGRAILSPLLPAGVPPGGIAQGTGYVYGPILPPGGATLGNAAGGSATLLNHGELVTAGPVQGGTLKNSQTTGGAAAAVTVTIAGVTGFRVHVYSIEARCNTAMDTTTGVTLTDAAVTKWTTGPTDVPPASVNYRRVWTPGYTAGDGAAVVVTLAACTAGTGTLIIQADQF